MMSPEGSPLGQRTVDLELYLRMMTRMKTMTTMAAAAAAALQPLSPTELRRHARDPLQQVSRHQHGLALLVLHRLCNVHRLQPPLLSDLHSPICKTTISRLSVAVARQPLSER